MTVGKTENWLERGLNYLLITDPEDFYDNEFDQCYYYNTIQYNTIQYNTIQYNTIQYNTIQYNTMQCNAMQYNTIQYNTKT